MRAALAELAEFDVFTAEDVASRAAHEAACNCTDVDCLDQYWPPTRPQLVSARRALHALAANGAIELHRNERSGLIARRRQPLPEISARDSDQPLVDIRETDRCDSCGRIFAEVGAPFTTSWGEPEAGVYRVRGPALCYECENGIIDPLAQASSGEFTVQRRQAEEAAPPHSRTGTRGQQPT